MKENVYEYFIHSKHSIMIYWYDTPGLQTDYRFAVFNAVFFKQFVQFLGKVIKRIIYHPFSLISLHDISDLRILSVS